MLSYEIQSRDNVTNFDILENGNTIMSFVIYRKSNIEAWSIKNNLPYLYLLNGVKPYASSYKSIIKSIKNLVNAYNLTKFQVSYIMDTIISAFK